MLTCHNGLYKEAKHAEHGQAAVLDLLDLMQHVSVREIRCATMQSQSHIARKPRVKSQRATNLSAQQPFQ